VAKIKLEKIPVGELVEYERNPRRNEKAIGAVKESIKKFGYLNPIIVNADNVILCGHTRLEAILETPGLDVVECIRLTHLSEQEERAFRIADNRAAEFSSWDKDALADEMQGITADDWEKFGFKAKELDQLKPPENCTCPKCGKSFIRI
jgi:ParB-like chromosome segregation protein Spo0J